MKCSEDAALFKISRKGESMNSSRVGFRMERAIELEDYEVIQDKAKYSTALWVHL